MLNHGSRSLSLLLALSLIAVACGDDDDDTGGTGGTSGKGGSTSTGGKVATGGTTTSGGTSGKGGTTSTGGTATSGGTGNATGGVVSTGGTTTTGGASTGGTAGEVGGGAGGFGGDDSVDGGAGGSGGEATVVPDTIDNPGFEVWVEGVNLPSWTSEGDIDAANKEWKALGIAHGGNYYLNNWRATAYVVTTSQLVSPLPNGNYSLSIWQQGGAYASQYVFARGYDSANSATQMVVNTAPNSAWTEIVVSPIPVTSGHVEIGVYSNGAADSWSHFDDVTLTKLP
jgi:hypothetical protein